jgi:hypothetical protein
MEKNISLPWAVTAIVVAVLIVGVIIWRSQTPRAPASGERSYSTYDQYRGQFPSQPPR